MENLDPSQRQRLEHLHTQVDLYQTDPNLCGELNKEQYVILAELQTIYNRLTKKSTSKVQTMFPSDCFGVRQEMEQFSKAYIGMDSKDLYEIYLKKYREAKGGTLNLEISQE